MPPKHKDLPADSPADNIRSKKNGGANNNDIAASATSASRPTGTDVDNTKDNNPPAVDPQVLDAIRLAIQPVLDAQTSIQASQQTMAKKLDEALDELSIVRNKVGDLEAAVQHSSDRVDTIVSNTLPGVTQHISSIATALAMRQLDLDVHQRKWALVISGVDGAAREKEDDTRASCLALAKNALKVADAMNTGISACHRLSPEANSAIYIWFADLQQRNNWLSNAKNLAGRDNNISISPDIPPVLRQLKKDLLAQRRELAPNVRKHSSIHHIKQWPYMILKIRNQADQHPKVSQQTIVRDVLGLNPLLATLD